MPLIDRLLARIDADGPLGVDAYVEACLNDPQEGYYAAAPRLGAEGDFITAPHVSQVFGEMLGLWAAQVWEGLGRPDPVRLVEVGPGDGTMMGDVRRALRASPEFAAASQIVLVEPSAPLRAIQQARLGETARWAETIEAAAGAGPVIILANEVLDCLPLRQGVVTAEGARERRIGRAGEALAFVADGEELAPPRWTRPGSPPAGQVFEWSDAARALGRRVGRIIAQRGGAGLFIDYARDEDAWGDTLQALQDHRRVDPLASPGQADLTAHADFAAFAAGAREGGARTTPVVSQAALLRALGIEVRADALARLHPHKADLIRRQLERLTGVRGMGLLFKAICVWSGEVEPPGFASAT
ncbi:MAG TPA: SAM-dependent methyltransferase [Caulobacteraceae bacterium]|jgi:SAM-dependent MidA family methyltransferase|nr:SAM-dependent methyltransferase [Caulobacteraceae bacterium]